MAPNTYSLQAATASSVGAQVRTGSARHYADDRDEEAPFSEAEKERETKPGLWGFNEAAAEIVYKVIRC